jgi:hypothetical protein
MKVKTTTKAPVGSERTWLGRHKAGLAVGALLFCLSMIVFADVLFSENKVVGGADQDLRTQFAYWRQLGFEELGHGNLPLWNPHVFCGVPFAGSFRSAMFYPPNLIFLALPLGPAINWSIALHVWGLGMFMYFWARRRGLTAPGAGLAGAIAMLGAPFYLHVFAGHLDVISTIIWAPLIFAAIDALLERGMGAVGRPYGRGIGQDGAATPARGTARDEPRVRTDALLLGAMAVGMQITGGQVQCVYYTGIAATIYALLNMIVRRPRAAGAMRFWGLFAAIFAFGASLAAVQLLTGIDAASESTRSALPANVAASFSLPPENLLTLISPYVLGGAGAGYWGRWFFWEMMLFMGVITVALALYGAFKAPRATRRFSGTMVIVLAVLAMGSYTPLYKLLYAALPGFNKFRGCSKFMMPMAMFASLLAGMGLDCLVREKARKAYPIALGVGAVVLASLAGLVQIGAASHDGQGPVAKMMSIIGEARDSAGKPQSYVPLKDYSDANHIELGAQCAGSGLLNAAGVLAVGAAVVMVGRRWPKVNYVLGALVIAELLAFAIPGHGSFDIAKLLPQNSQEFLARRGTHDRVHDHNPDNFNATMSVGGYEIGGYEPGAARLRYAQYVVHQQGKDISEVTDYVDFEQRKPDPPGAYPRYEDYPYPLLRLKYYNHSFGVVDVGAALPHLQLVKDYRVVTGGAKAVLSAMDSGKDSPDQFDPARTVILESPPDAVAGSPATCPYEATSLKADAAAPSVVSHGQAVNVAATAPAAEDLGSARIVEESTDWMIIKADVKKPAILLITDAYASGWRATGLDTISQKEYQVMPADYAMRAIPLAQGQHTFKLQYMPRAFVIGKWISLACVAVWAALVILCVWRGRMIGQRQTAEG